LAAQGRKVSHSVKANNYAPKMFAAAAALDEDAPPHRSEQDYAKAMERLFGKGKLRIVQYGPPSRPFEHLARA